MAPFIEGDDVERLFATNDILALQLPAGSIPDRSSVRKKTGEYAYTLRRKLVLYAAEKGEKPVNIDGLFLINERGDINQVKPDTVLVWLVNAEDLYMKLQESFEEDTQ